MRKSIKLGPFRMTFSKSGVSTSFGIKGARVSKSSRGTYVTIGSKGIRYKKRIDKPKYELEGYENLEVNSKYSYSQDDLDEIVTVDSDQTTDEVFKDFIDEIHKKHKRPMYSFFIGLALLFLLSNIQVSDDIRITLVLVMIPAVIWLWQQDVKNKQVIVNYQFDEDSQNNYKRFVDNLKDYKSSKVIWRIIASKETSDYKNNAGASNLIRRVPLKVDVNKKLIKSNVDIYSMKLGKEHIVFLPDRMIFMEKGKIGALAYKEVYTTYEKTRFIEDGIVPRDSKHIDNTWRFVNKNGTPDRRYNNNKIIPIMEYGQITINSKTGVNYVLMTSKAEASSKLNDALNI